MEKTTEKTLQAEGIVGDATVGEITDHRERNTCLEHPLKQKDCNVEYDTLEPEKQSGCALVSENENTRKQKRGLKKRGVEKRKRSAMVEKQTKNVTLVGFDRNLEPEKIIGATNRTGVLQFLMKWKSCDEIDLVLAKEAHKICPQIVIKFYEDRLKWSDEYVVEGRVL